MSESDDASGVVEIQLPKGLSDDRPARPAGKTVRQDRPDVRHQEKSDVAVAWVQQYVSRAAPTPSSWAGRPR
ncbi:MAG: hypothetical protein AB7G48_12565 [Nitrospiraceae bacterium]